MSSAPMPKAARGAVALALLIATVSGLSIRSGPIMLVGVCFAACCALIGILRKRAWSAYGFGGLLLLGILAILFFSLTGNGSGNWLQTIVSVVLYSGIAGIFLISGYSLAHTGAPKGSPIPWILMALLLIAPFVYFRPVSLSSGDMQDTLLIGDFVLVDRFPSNQPALDEVVAFHFPRDRNQILIRRIIGLPGDHIQLTGGQLFRNGKPVSEPYLKSNSPAPPPFEATVPENKYLVLGDARDHSRDSRQWGFVDRADLIGKPRFIYDSLAPDPADIKPAPASSGDYDTVVPSHSPVRRWDRVFSQAQRARSRAATEEGTR